MAGVWLILSPIDLILAFDTPGFSLDQSDVSPKSRLLLSMVVVLPNPMDFVLPCLMSAKAKWLDYWGGRLSE